MAKKAVPALIAGCVAMVLAGCTSGQDNQPAPSESGSVSIESVRAALLQPNNIADQWTAPAQPPPATGLLGFCGGAAASPPVPGTPAIAKASAVDEEDVNAQTFDQIGLVYKDEAAAQAGLKALRDHASGCPKSVTKPATQRGDGGTEYAYTESVKAQSLDVAGWYGFQIERHKQYEPKHPGTADTVVAVLAWNNVVLVTSFARYFVGQHSSGPEFTDIWHELVGAILDRVPSA